MAAKKTEKVKAHSLIVQNYHVHLNCFECIQGARIQSLILNWEGKQDYLRKSNNKCTNFGFSKPFVSKEGGITIGSFCRKRAIKDKQIPFYVNRKIQNSERERIPWELEPPPM